jgi:hypothetical protein
MELLPPSIDDPDLLQLIGDILTVQPAGPSRMAVRLRLMSPNASWSRLVTMAQQQGVLIPLIHALRRDSLLLPVPRTAGPVDREAHVTSRLEAAWRDHLTRAADLTDQLATIVRAFAAAGIATMPLKGARHLAAPLTAWCPARVMRDLDLCVPADRLAEAVKTLASLGYRPIEEGTAFDHHAPAMALPDRHGAVEVHCDALALGGRKVLPTATVWDLSAPVPFAGADVHVLPLHWHMLHGLLHHQVAERGHRRRILALKGLFEFASLAADVSAPQWAEIAAHMADKGQAVVLGSWLRQAEVLFGLPHPPGVPIDAAARDHAADTIAFASASYGRRRRDFILDQMRYAFARETLAHRYGLAENDVGIGTAVRQSAALIGRYGLGIVARIAGRRDQAS